MPFQVILRQHLKFKAFSRLYKTLSVELKRGLKIKISRQCLINTMNGRKIACVILQSLLCLQLIANETALLEDLKNCLKFLQQINHKKSSAIQACINWSQKARSFHRYEEKLIFKITKKNWFSKLLVIFQQTCLFKTFHF